jgi:NAD(P)-dependent dehydrogenase (short-subunit alcohol dehydrogenase family)
LTRLPPGAVARHVVALGSMVRYAGNPHGLGYLTSKRALADCFAAWSGMYAGTDLVFQQVLLGPVRTAIYTMADRFPAWMGWLKDRFSAPLDGTARAIARFARTRRRTLRYPRPALLLFLAMRLGQGVGFFRGRRTLAGKPRRTG